MAVAAMCVLSCNKKEGNEAETPATANDSVTAITGNDDTEFTKQCYLQVTSRKTDYGNRKTLSDSIIFNIERQEGDSIWGIFHWKPAEKDKKISTFKGTLFAGNSGSTGHVVANSNAEGMNYNEEVNFKLKDNQLTVYFGEMTEGKDGIWLYKDQNRLSEQVLNKVDCK